MIPVYKLDFFTNSAADNDIQFLISDQLFLETLLMEIRGKTLSFSAYKKKQREQQEKKLIADIETLENNQNVELDTVETKKIELENIRKEKLQGIIIRSRVKWAEEGEKPTRYFCIFAAWNQEIMSTKLSQKSKKKIEA